MLWYHRPRSKGLVFAAYTLALAIVFTALLTRTSKAAAAQPKEIPLPVIMYHHILESSKLLGAYCITPAELRSDFERIRQDGYTPVVVADLLDYVYNDVPLPEKPIMITFDDGYESNYAYAYPLLQEYGY
ncbi:MAG: polysaccharide deacetylase family protein, partial [Oscillospiraceae bacterium]|nr:polysaccharide deacetylase family protein [Oscillospiraceae bacterium]